MDKEELTKSESKPIEKTMKFASIGWLLGRSLIVSMMVIRDLKNDPAHAELVAEAKTVLNRWKIESKL